MELFNMMEGLRNLISFLRMMTTSLTLTSYKLMSLPETLLNIRLSNMLKLFLEKITLMTEL